MLRYLSALALLGTVVLVSVEAQVYTIQPRPMTVDNRPRGGFSLSLRYSGSANVTFEDVGTITSNLNVGDMTSRAVRVYHDGFIGSDSRGGGDDGRTNTWSYDFDSQVTAGGDIAFHRYATTTNGTDVRADAGSMQGVDMQYDYVIGVGGSNVTDRAWTFTWGVMAGGVFSPVNASTRQTISANLVTLEDIYSLEGAAVPEAPYSAPSTTTVNGTDAAGNPVSFIVDNTTLINNRPYERTTTTLADGASIDGFWQVKGGYYSFRLGPWVRWQLFRNLSVRASVGATYSFLGVKMEHDEVVADLETDSLLRGGMTSDTQRAERYGAYGALDVEWWLSDRTGFFAGVTYEDTGEDVVLRAGERQAVIELPNGTGFRAGISVLF